MSDMYFLSFEVQLQVFHIGSRVHVVVQPVAASSKLLLLD